MKSIIGRTGLEPGLSRCNSSVLTTTTLARFTFTSLPSSQLLLAHSYFNTTLAERFEHPGPRPCKPRSPPRAMPLHMLKLLSELTARKLHKLRTWEVCRTHLGFMRNSYRLDRTRVRPPCEISRTNSPVLINEKYHWRTGTRTQVSLVATRVSNHYTTRPALHLLHCQALTLACAQFTFNSFAFILLHSGYDWSRNVFGINQLVHQSKLYISICFLLF